MKISLSLLSICFIYYLASVTTSVSGNVSHYCYERRSYYARVRRYSYRFCYCPWNIYRCRYAYYTREIRYYQRRICCTGWRGTACNIPICNPSCLNNGVCHAVDTCYCRPPNTGDRCGTAATCSFATDCYPGTCEGSSQCRCSSGFDGTACNIVRDGGSVTSCTATIDALTQNSYETDCLNPNENKYTNLVSLDDIKLDWRVTWPFPDDVPVAPNYVVESRPGIISTHSRIRLLDQSDQTLVDNTQACLGHNVSASNPFLIVECRNIFHTVISHNAQDGYKLEISFVSETGGFKVIKNEVTNQVQNRMFDGTTHVSETIEIHFDLQKPFHCVHAIVDPCEYIEFPGLSVYPDNRQDTELPLEIFGWDDAISFIEGYNFKFYQMQYNEDQSKLVHGDMLNEISWQVIDEPPVLTVENPGVYSVLMEIFDYAGNSAKARTLVITDQTNHVTVEDVTALTVEPSQMSDSGMIWIAESGGFTIQWPGLFANMFHVNNYFMEEAAPLNSIDIDDNGVDIGNRTTAAVEHYMGIARFDFGWRKLPLTEVTWEVVGDLTETFTVSNLDREDGDVLELTLIGYDITDYMKSHEVLIYVDSSPPALSVPIQPPQFQLNVVSGEESIFFASRLDLAVTDPHSGISVIQFTIHDTSLGIDQQIYRGTQFVQSYSGSRQSECIRTGRCYCTDFDTCYDSTVALWINNCWFIGHDTSSVTIDYTIRNTARLEYSHRYQVGVIDDLNGIGHYPTPRDIATTRNRGGSLDLIWSIPPSCYPYRQIILRYTQGETQVATLGGNATRHTLHGLEPDSQLILTITVIFNDTQGTTRQSDEVTFSTEPIKEEVKSDAGLTGGAIAGIVIALLVIALLVAALIFMGIRYKRHQHPVPLVLREASANVREGISHRFSRHPAGAAYYDNRIYNEDGTLKTETAVNVAYATEEDDMYIYGNMETDPNATWKQSSDSLTITGTVPGAKGRFADLRLARLQAADGTVSTVVVKMNKTGASDEDKLLMTAKMNFLATAVPKHPLIVGLIGGVPAAPPKGPMLLLEYCNAGSLLQWAEKLGKITGDIEDQMVTFTMQTAVGMHFLHDKGLLHRRLGARNVLLHTDPQTHQMIARLSGFGPLKGEQDGGNGGHRNDKVPIKWMAPEQFNKPPGEKRVYSKKTDAWSYGIVLWELFSKGGKPYSDKTIGEMKKAVTGGHRMKKPTDCPHFLFTEVMEPCWEGEPEDRPEFSDIVAKMKREYGAEGGDIYNYDENYGQRFQGNAMQVD